MSILNFLFRQRIVLNSFTVRKPKDASKVAKGWRNLAQSYRLLNAHLNASDCERRAEYWEALAGRR